MDVARVGLVAAVEGGAGVVPLVGGLGGGGDGERAVGEDLLAPVARQLVAVCKGMREKGLSSWSHHERAPSVFALSLRDIFPKNETRPEIEIAKKEGGLEQGRRRGRQR